jgi:hypothetical protein
MKKLLALTLTLASVGFIASSAEAKATRSVISSAAITAASVVEPQGRYRMRRWRGNRRVRVVTQTRLVHRGRQIYRETYQVSYLPNGGTRTRLVSRVRVR